MKEVNGNTINIISMDEAHKLFDTHLFGAPPEVDVDLTLEEDVVDDWLTLEGDGDRLVLGENIVLADTELFSKQEIRELESDVRGELEAMVYEVTARLRSEIAKEFN